MSTAPPKKALTEAQKKQLLSEILGAKYSSAGNNFAAFSKIMDYHGNVHDIISLAELIPAANTLLSGSIVGGALSASSIIGTFLFPVIQFVNLINANEAGHQMYSYRCVAYTVTSWAFSLPTPKKSQRIMGNLTSGTVVRNQLVLKEYDALWLKTSGKVLQGIKAECNKKHIPEDHAKIIFRALCGKTPDVFCRSVLESFEQKLGYAQKLVWKSNYSIIYPN